MQTGGEAADQVLKMSLEGIEMIAKLSGAGAKNLAVFLYAVLKEEKKVSGKSRLKTMLKSGKELTVFAVRSQDLETFTKEAKKYGVMYCALKEKNNEYGICDIMVRAEDASKIERIVDKFNLATVDTATIKNEILKSKEDKANHKDDVQFLSDDEHEALIDQLMGTTPSKDTTVPSPASTKKSPPFEISSDVGTDERPSIRNQIKEIKDSQKKLEQPSKQKTQSRNQSSKHKPVKKYRRKGKGK